MASQETRTAGTDNASTQAGRRFTIIGFVLSAVALILAPILFGPAGAIFGGIGWSKGDRLGMWAVVAGVVATLLGFALAAWVLNKTN